MFTVHQRTWLSIVVICLGIIGLSTLIILSPLRDLLTSSERLQQTVQSFGWYAPIVIICIHILQVVVAPIPGQAIDIANGYLFGWLGGTVVSLIGLGIGSLIVIGLAKRFGRPLVAVLITPKGLKAIHPYTRRRSQLFFFLLFLLPGTPDDLLCFAIGLSSIEWKRAFAIAMLGRSPGIIAAVVAGASGRGLNPITFAAAAIAVSILIGWVIWKTPLGERVRRRTDGPP